MKRSLRKTTTGISVTYSDGNFSNNLTGTEFELEESKDSLTLSINLAGNLHVRNKSANCYADACELVENHSSLQSVQIDEERIIDGLIAAAQKTPNLPWRLTLLFAEKVVFQYAVKPTASNGSLFFNVCS